MAFLLLLIVGRSMMAAEAPPDWSPRIDRTLVQLERFLIDPPSNLVVETLDPAVSFLGGMTGLGGDVLTLATADGMSEIWPAWSMVSDQLDRFGLVVLAWGCLRDVTRGQPNAAAWSATKAVFSKLLARSSRPGAIYAAYFGVFDLALDYLGNASVAQIRSDYWRTYCAFHFVERRGVDGLLDIFERDGLGGLYRRLDRFWDDPVSDGMRGWFTLTAHDPHHREHFRWRFIREHLIEALLERAEELRSQTRLAAMQAARELAADLQRTSVVITVPVTELHTGEPAHGYRATLSARFQDIATATIAGEHLTLEVAYPDLLDEHGHLADHLRIRLEPVDGVTGEVREITVPTGRGGRRVVMEAQRHRITYRVRPQIAVRTSFPVTVRLDGQTASRRPRVEAYLFRWRHDPVQGELYREGLRHRIASVELRDGRCVFPALPAGRYWFRIEDRLDGPHDIHGPAEVAIQYAPATAEEAREQVPESDAAVGEAHIGAFAEAVGNLSETLSAQLDALNGKQETLWAQLMADALAAGRDAAAWRARARIAEGDEAAAAHAMARQRDQEQRQRLAAIDALAEQWQHRLIGAVSQASDQRQEITAGLEVDPTIRQLRESLPEADPSAVRTLGRQLLTAAWQHEDDPDAVMTAAQAGIASLRGRQTAMIEQQPAWTALAEQAANAERRHEAWAAFFDHTTPVPDAAVRIRSAALANAWSAQQLDPQPFAQALERYQRRQQARRQARIRAEALLAELDALIAALPEVDEREWGAAGAQFAARFQALVEAPMAAPLDDDPWQRFHDDLEAWLLARREICGDLLPDPLTSDTAYAAYTEAFARINPGSLGAVVPREWWGSFRTRVATTAAARRRLVRPLIALHADSRKVLAFGIHRVADLAEVQEAIAMLLDWEAMTDSDGRRERLQAADVLLERLPSFLAARLRVLWQERRRELVVGGDLLRLLQRSGQPHLIIVSIDGEPVEAPWYWPDQQPTERHSEIVVRLDGVAPGTLAAVYWRRGGGPWQEVRRQGDTWHLTAFRAPGQTALEFSVDLGAGACFHDPLFPAILWPDLRP